MLDAMNHHSGRNHRSHRRLREDEEHRRHGQYHTREHGHTEHAHQRSQVRGRHSSYSNSRCNGNGWDSRNDTGNEANQNPGIIENWLSNISRRGVSSPTAVETQNHGREPIVARSPGWRPHNLDLGSLRQGHKRSRPRDSSFIGNASRNDTPVALLHGRHHDISLPTQTQHQHQIVDQVARRTDMSSLGTPSPDFKKRARHKTRDDRYDSNRQLRQRHRRSRKETSEQPEVPPRKKTLSSGKDVMNSFHSEAILQDRLTLQPNISDGLFQNGRISTPNPVGELAYNSMTAIENPMSLVSSRAQHNRSRAKEKQSREREVDKMVAFFGRKETPPNEVLPAIPIEAPDSSAHRGFSTQPDSAHLDRRRPSYRTSTESFERGLALRADEARLRPPSSGPLSVLVPRASSRTTSYVSWSTSEHAQPSIRRACTSRDANSTPESIREELQQTGVFNGTRKMMSGRETNVVTADRMKSHKRHCMDRDASAGTGRDVHQVSPMKLHGIIRYQDRGVMTAADLPPMPNDQLKMKSTESPFNDHEEARGRGVDSLKGIIVAQHSPTPVTPADTSDQNGHELSNKLPSDQRNKEGMKANRAVVGEQAPVDVVSKEICVQTSLDANQPQLCVPVPSDDICEDSDRMEAAAPAPEITSVAIRETASVIDGSGRTVESRETTLGSQQTQQSTPLSVTAAPPSLTNATWKSSTLYNEVLNRDHIPGASASLYDECTDSMGAQQRHHFLRDAEDAFNPSLPPVQESRVPYNRLGQIMYNEDPSQCIDTLLSQPRESLAEFIARAERDTFGNRDEEGVIDSYHGDVLNDNRHDVRYSRTPYTENPLHDEFAVIERQPEYTSWHITDAADISCKGTERLPVNGYDRDSEINHSSRRTHLNEAGQDDELAEELELWPPNLF